MSNQDSFLLQMPIVSDNKYVFYNIHFTKLYVRTSLSLVGRAALHYKYPNPNNILIIVCTAPSGRMLCMYHYRITRRRRPAAAPFFVMVLAGGGM